VLLMNNISEEFENPNKEDLLEVIFFFSLAHY
jgi:hypothetical protein